MNAAPGWYQDTQRPAGHLRFWDGRQWTEHRHALPMPGAAPVVRSGWSSAGLWMRQHKLATVVLAFVALALVGSVMPDDVEPDPVSAASGDDEDEARDDSTGSGQKAKAGREGTSKSAGEKSRSRKDAQQPAGDGKSDTARATTKVIAPKPKPAAPTYYVSRIIDGDTIELGNGETVRLVGIDTPEVGECGFEEASANLSSLILGEMVRLGESDEDRDNYGRLLRYVDLGDMDAGLRLIKNGRAIAAYDSRDGYGFHPRETTYIASDRGSTNLCRMQTGQQAAPEPAPQPKPKPQPLMGGNGNAGGNCASGYSPCLPVVADLNCPDVNGPVRVTGSDPYGLDADGDGIGCDS